MVRDASRELKVIGIIKSALIMGMSLAFLWMFYHIATKGRVYLEEQNVFVLTGEIVILVGILVFSLYCYVCGVRRLGRQNDDND